MTSDAKFPKWLTYHCWRNTAWEEHDSAPLRAIKYWQGTNYRHLLKIFEISETGQMIARTVEEVLDVVS